MTRDRRSVTPVYEILIHCRQKLEVPVLAEEPLVEVK